MDPATPLVATGAAALGLYMYYKGRNATNSALTDGGLSPSIPVEAWRHNDVSHPPSTWGEALLYLKEAFRYVYTESLGRWHTADLFIGLAYLSHREALEYPSQDIALRSRPINLDLTPDAAHVLLAELREVRRYLLYCRGLKYKKESQQVAFWQEHVQLDPSWVLAQQSNAGLLRPAYVLIADEQMRCILLCIRGTQSTKDLFTSLAATTKPHHKVQANGVVLGYSHMGMLAAARWLMRQVAPLVKSAMADNEGYRLCIVGHSMGAGTAALLTTMLRESLPGCAEARCYAMACPACMTYELADSCRDYVTSIINGTDIVPTFSGATMDSLREEVRNSSWFVEFQRDLRSSAFRALQGGMRGMGTATQWTARNILQPATVPFRTCYSMGKLNAATGDPAQILAASMATTEADLAAALVGTPPQQQQAKQQHGRDQAHAQDVGPAPLASASHVGGSVSTQALRRRLWPWGQGGSSGGGAPVDAEAATVSFGGWIPERGRDGDSADVMPVAASPGRPDGGSSGQEAAAPLARGEDGPGATAGRGSAYQNFSRWWWPRPAAPASGPGGSSPDPGPDITSQQDVGLAEPLPRAKSLSETAATAAARAGGSGARVRRRVSQAGAGPSSLLLWQGMFKTCVTERSHAGAAGQAADPPGSNPTAASAAGSTHVTDDTDDLESSSSEEYDEMGGLLGSGLAPAAGDGGEAELLLMGPVPESQLQEGIAAVVEAMTHGEIVDGEEDEEGEEGEQTPGQEADLSGAPDEATTREQQKGAESQPPRSQTATASSSGPSDALPEPHAAAAQAYVAGCRNAGGPASGSGRPAASAPVPVPKRHLYPAGRILHLFPQSVLTVGVPPSEADREEDAAQQPPESTAAATPLPEPLAEFMPVPRGMQPTGNDVAAARMSALQSPHVLVEVQDNRVYSRIKLCRTMVLDHMTPSYLTALGSVIRQLEDQVTGLGADSRGRTEGGSGGAPDIAAGVLLTGRGEAGAQADGWGMVRQRPVAKPSRPIVGPDGELL